MKKFTLLLLALCVVMPDLANAAQSINGRWRVKTTLVAASGAVNPNYRADHNRIEKWVIKGNRRHARLRSHAGSINGIPAGKAWVFNQYYDTGYGIIVHMYIVARKRGSGGMRGTIEVTYYSNASTWITGEILKVGLDAWRFTGKKR